jgi:hypothetical protein
MPEVNLQRGIGKYSLLEGVSGGVAGTLSLKLSREKKPDVSFSRSKASNLTTNSQLTLRSGRIKVCRRWSRAAPAWFL